MDWKIENAPDPRRARAVRRHPHPGGAEIAKEALVNVAKHAQAQKVRVLVTLDEDGVTVEVGDDGIGLPPGVQDLSAGASGRRRDAGPRGRSPAARSPSSSDATGTTVSVWLPRV